jgi:2-dehydropantoate 2-reductase
MKIAVMGSGGVGGFFGGLLARSGHEVHFVARGAHLQAIQERGLRVEALDGPFTIAPAHATENPAEVGLADLVLLCVKTYDLDGAIEQLRPVVGPQTAVLTLQNGVEAPDRAAAAYGPDVALPGIVYCEVAVRAPGVIFQGSPVRRLIFGTPDGVVTPQANAVAGAFATTGVDTTLSENILGALWSKFCFICAMSGATALARQPLGPLLADEEGRALMRATMEEARAVGLAKGVRFDADPVEAGLANAARFPYAAKSSMLRDLERGGRLEIEALNGAVVRLGRTVGVPTPANQAIYAALRFAQPSV